MRTYLVTGGAGFIGSNYIHYMFKKYGKDIRIINVDALTYAGNPENLEDIEKNPDYDYTFVKADVCDREAISKIFAENDIDRVVHFAAESHVDRSIADPGIFVKTNVEGTANMLACARAAWEREDGTYPEDKKFLHVSTDEVYGSLPEDGGYFYETTPYSPHSPYSASKAGSDMLVRAYMDTYKFPANITNCSNNYGPYQFPEKLIPLIIHNALEGKKLPVYGDGKNVRDWLYVEDHAKAIDMVQEKGRLFETYNVGGHNEKQNIEIVKTIIDVLRDELPDDDPRKAHLTEDLITYVQDRKGHDRRYAIAPDKIKAEIGWEPETMFKDGIKKTIRWYFDNQEWMEHVTSGDYERFYVAEDGHRYQHIIDPQTLRPATRYRSVTIITPDSGDADCLSTALTVLSIEDGEAVLDAYRSKTGNSAEAIWILSENESVNAAHMHKMPGYNIVYTEGLENCLVFN